MAVAADFADRVDQVREMEALASLLEAAARDLGFDYYALVEHANIVRPPASFMCAQNYPEGWVEIFAHRRLHALDPVQALASRQLAGFIWSDLPRLMALTPAQQAILTDAAHNGLGAGYTVPLHAPFGRTASASFVMMPGRPLPQRAFLAAECTARLAFHVATTILAASGKRLRLTLRQRQCVALMAQGKTDWEIAFLLGLHEDTVTKYLDAARARFGVARRTQLALAALSEGEIALDEVISWQ
jgi:LuxR family quorum-sensing system transcriptional regulator CciR